PLCPQPYGRPRPHPQLPGTAARVAAHALPPAAPPGSNRFRARATDSGVLTGSAIRCHRTGALDAVAHAPCTRRSAPPGLVSALGDPTPCVAGAPPWAIDAGAPYWDYLCADAS